VRKLETILVLIGVGVLASSCANRIGGNAAHSLLDGFGLDGWQGLPEPVTAFAVEGNEIRVQKGEQGAIFTKDQYQDFVLKFDFLVDSGSECGVALRSPMTTNPIELGPVIQLSGERLKAGRSPLLGAPHGSLIGIQESESPWIRPNSEWNSQEIRCYGRQIVVLVNGRLVLDVNLNRIDDKKALAAYPGVLRDKGAIGLIAYGSELRLKNLEIRELQRPQLLNTAPEGFINLFNGRTLEGWQGQVEDPVKRREISQGDYKVARVQADDRMHNNWRVRDSELSYVGEGFDNIYTKRDFRDFELTVEWKIEAKADSGVYLRECPQVQIWDEQVGSGGLFNNQKHLSTPTRRADRDHGDWNTFRILLLGNRATVWLNDVLVVHNVVMENYWERDKPLYPDGPIGLQAHASEVSFRNIYTRDIPPDPTRP